MRNVASPHRRVSMPVGLHRVSAAIEFAVRNSETILVLGHAQWRRGRGPAATPARSQFLLGSWISLLGTAKARIQGHHGPAQTALEYESIRVTENLRTFPCVEDAIAKGDRARVMGGGQRQVLNGKTGAFEPIV